MRANYRLQRLYVDIGLAAGEAFEADRNQFHYLAHVIRAEDGADRDGARRGVASHFRIRPRRSHEIVLILHDKIDGARERSFRRRGLADFDRLALPDVPQPRHRREGEVVHEVFFRKRLRRVRRLVDLGQRLCGNQNFTARSC